MSMIPEPPCLKFVPIEQSEVTSISKTAGFKFRLVSYNVLAQAYVKSAFFPHSPAPCLKWKARSQAILNILKSLEADFLCLQEVDEYDTFYKKNMETLGFASSYIQRSGRKRDGCGIFYKRNSAELVIEEKINYNDLVDAVGDGKTSSVDKENRLLDDGIKAESRTDGSESNEARDNDRGDPNNPRVRLKRDCVGIMAAFRLNNPYSHHVIIANTHLYWDPEWADVKIAQAKYLLSRLAGFKKLVSNKFNCTPSIIVAGDLNSVPGDEVYQYLVSGNNLVGPETADELPIPLSSVYAVTRGEPEFTNCTPGFTGRIIEDEKSMEPEIICDNSGALVIEAQASIPLKEFDFHDLNHSIQGKLVSIDQRYPVQVQITNYICGGISVTFTFDHALGDATAFGKFLVTWSEIAMNKPISCSPDHSRNLRARFPPSYDPLLDEVFITCTLEDIRTMPTISILLKRLYYVDSSSIEKLQRLASVNGQKKTKIEAFSAYIWKILANVVDKKHKFCKMGWLVDGRSRISKHQGSMSDYIGNVLSLAFGESNVTDLKQGSVADIAKIVHNTISTITNEEHFRNLIDWIECHRPGLMLSKSVLGLGGPAIVVSSGRRFPVAELDFGFGSPVLGTVCSTIERIGVGYINQRQSARGDGSWTVSAILWPEMAVALESDPDHIFQPMNLKHLQL